MRFLANENFPASAISELQKLGHDVASVRLRAAGANDDEVLAWAVREGRILLTFDKDFGELAKASHLPASCGIVLFRVSVPKPGDVGQLAALLAGRSDWAGHFTVVEPGRIRMRPIASSG